MKNNTTFVRVEKNRNYTTIHNEFLKRKDLSWKAKGIMTYLLSLPDDWVVNLDEIKRNATDGESSFRSGWKELVSAGYASRQPVRDDKTKKIMSWETVIKEMPDEQKSHNVENHNVESHQVGNRKLLSTKELSTNKLNTNKQSTEATNYPSAAQTYYENHIGMIKPIILEDLQFYGEKFIEADEIIKRAIDIAISRSAKNWGYVKAILRSWQQEGLETLEQVDTHEKGDNKNQERSFSIDDL